MMIFQTTLAMQTGLFTMLNYTNVRIVKIEMGVKIEIKSLELSMQSEFSGIIGLIRYYLKEY